MNRFSISPAAMLEGAWRHRALLRQLMYREIMGRYNGSVLGIVWSFFNPVLMLVIYTFVFSVVFKARWHGGTDSKTEFAILLFVGMIVFGVFSECVNRAPSLIIGNPNYVKKVVFPLDILPLAVLGSAFFHAAISILVLLLFCTTVGQNLPMTAILLPLILLPLAMMTIGLCWFLSALSVYVRDITQTISLATTVLMFLSPVFYPLDALPDEIRITAALNPLAFIIESSRDLLIFGKLPGLTKYSLNLILGLFIAELGFAWFQKARKGFGDVL